jgi:hypothetical protein
MSVLIRINGRKAFFRDGAWVCSDRALEARLNAEMEQWIEETGGPLIGARDPEFAAAKEIAARCGGGIVHHVPARGDRGASRFLARRQMTLGFD